MKRYKRNLAVLLTAVTAVLSAGCEIEEVPRAAVEEERQVLEEASSLAYTGDLEDITLTSDLTADGVIAGSIKETGFWNTKYTVTAGGEDWFYLGDPKDNFIYNLEGVNSGTTSHIMIWMTCALAMPRRGSWRPMDWNMTGR